MLRLITLWICLTVALFAAGCVVQPITPESATPPTPEEAAEEEVEAPSPFTTDILMNLEYTLELAGGEPVQLTNGRYEDTANMITVDWIDTYALGDINEQPAAAVALLSSGGGSGIFSNLAIVLEQDGVPANVATTLLGDRVSINWVEIDNNEIVLDLVTQGPDEPMCCGTQRMVVSYALEDDQLVETDAQVIGAQPQISATQVITFVPEVIPEVTQTGSCFTNAIGLGRIDAWRCTTDDNSIHDPCFEVANPEGGDESIVVCGADPVTGERGFVLELTEPLPAPDPGNLSNAWLVQLSDGTICGLLTGTVPGVDGQVAPYGCADQARSNLMEDFLIFDPVWYAQSVVFDLGDEGFTIRSSVRIPIATIWR